MPKFGKFLKMIKRENMFKDNDSKYLRTKERKWNGQVNHLTRDIGIEYGRCKKYP